MWNVHRAKRGGQSFKERPIDARDIGVTDQDIGGDAFAGRAALVSYDRADRRVRNRSGSRPPGVHAVGCRRVFVDHLVMDRADDVEAVQDRRAPRQMLAYLRAGNRRVDRRVVRAGFLGLGIVQPFRILHVDVTCAAAQPDHDAMLRLAHRHRRIRLTSGRTLAAASPVPAKPAWRRKSLRCNAFEVMIRSRFRQTREVNMQKPYPPRRGGSTWRRLSETPFSVSERPMAEPMPPAAPGMRSLNHSLAAPAAYLAWIAHGA